MDIVLPVDPAIPLLGIYPEDVLWETVAEWQLATAGHHTYVGSEASFAKMRDKLTNQM